MNKRVTPWQCIRVCQDRKVDFAYASDYDEALARLARKRHGG